MTACLTNLIINTLEDMKALDITSLDICEISQFADNMIIATGTSTQHVKSIAHHLARKLKKCNHHILGIEGKNVGSWILLDIGNVVVHLMLPNIREFYHLESIWQPFTPIHAA